MKKLTILFILLSTFAYSQDITTILAVPTKDKDTLFVLDNNLGDLIIHGMFLGGALVLMLIEFIHIKGDVYVGPMNKIFEKYEVHTLSGLITTELEKFKHLGNVTLIRGLRNGSDLLYEQNYIQTLRDIDENINVAYFLTKPENAHVSSSMIRELIKIDHTKAIKYLPQD